MNLVRDEKYLVEIKYFISFYEQHNISVDLNRVVNQIQKLKGLVEK